MKIFSAPAVAMEDDAEVLSEKLRNKILALFLSQKINLTLNNRAQPLFFLHPFFKFIELDFISLVISGRK